MKIGNREIIHSVEFLCPKDERAKIDLKVLGAPVTVEFRFVEDDEVEGAKITRDGYEDSVFRVKLTNWAKGFGGVATPFPWEFGELPGKRLSLAATGQGISEVYTVFVQFMLEDTK